PGSRRGLLVQSLGAGAGGGASERAGGGEAVDGRFVEHRGGVPLRLEEEPDRDGPHGDSSRSVARGLLEAAIEDRLHAGMEGQLPLVRATLARTVARECLARPSEVESQGATLLRREPRVVVEQCDEEVLVAEMVVPETRRLVP